MAKNFIQAGTTIEFTAAADLTSGSVVVIGSQIGVVADDVATAEIGVAHTEGVWSLPKTATGALTVGTVIDYDVSAKTFTVIGTPAAGDVIGCAIVWEGAAAGDTEVVIKINPGIATIQA